jgi:protein ImuB
MSSLQSSRAGAEEFRFAEERRFLALYLPRWATDCLRRADPALAASPRPLVLWEKQKGAMRLVAVDDAAARLRLHPGLSLADARAQVPGVEAREIDLPYLEQVFTDFADWHSNASPIVSVLKDAATFGDLVLDVTGVSHLFGGEARMLGTLTGRLQKLGFAVQSAIAGTVGAAWASAHFSPGIVVPRGMLGEALADLPVTALRLEEEQIDGLDQLGLKVIGQLYGRDRQALQARFGKSLVTRFDQALGFVAETIRPRLPAPEYFAERRFPDPIGLIDDVLMCAEDLAVQLALQLEAQSLGGQAFHLFLYLVDHKVVSLSVNASQATRDAGHIARLFKHRAERLAGEYDPGFGIDMIRLGASSLSDVPSTQIGAFGASDGAEDIEKLLDRMTSRLGPLAMVRSRFVDTHIPERAVVLEPAVMAMPTDPEAVVPLVRPLRLFPDPEPIVVVAEVPDGPPESMIWRRIRYRFVKGSGPERIEAEWWRSGNRLQLALPDENEEQEETRDGKPLAGPKRYTPNLQVFSSEATLRDYYIAEDEAGRRFWIFRQGLYGAESPARWFLHGLFA